ncbi:MazG-like family protein [Mannheimia haemolytica]|uniref:NTP pyrophosphohydrolase MazG-like domain-containing protein n=1 Tax=Mannheimia haemolytica TaxID=75985 RepID=A0A378NGB5_MANHA|nr:MazG-like family protein [Mannheimia haemolytica]TCS83419.1 MazG-like nucleotide pyrophosphohydrolase family protein [Mannheimia haemolytica]UQX72644.1 MazG-like family protein [Mannheimia haemolytica]STY50819.1 Uncharacterised protein [Mannheimia haemolytica]STY67450.1 Uncharacterised protein [Mannheimia haemolytica]
MQQLIKNIEQWAEDRNLINGSTPQKQMLKLMEEFGELCAGVATNEFETILDSLGDCLVICTIMRKQLKMEKLFSISHCDNTNFNCGVAAQIVQANIDLGNVASELSRGCDLSRLEDYLSGFENQLDLIAQFYKTDVQTALLYAYIQIKNRKGKMIDGVFVKEGDL